MRERWPATRVVALDRPAVLAHGMGSGAIDRGAAGVKEIADADLVILAAPVRQNVSLLGELVGHVRRDTLITDVGGTKCEMVRAARGLPGSVTFVGGHPLAGAERGGFGFASPSLFRGRPWIFTPEPDSPPPAVARLFAFAEGLGARPALLDAAQHDRLTAFLSHLPQLVGSALMAVIGNATAGDGLRLAGRGLVDSTRLASSPVDVWRDICATNADAIGEALDELIARLGELRADLRREDVLERTFEEAARWRAELMKGRD